MSSVPKRLRNCSCCNICINSLPIVVVQWCTMIIRSDGIESANGRVMTDLFCVEECPIIEVAHYCFPEDGVEWFVEAEVNEEGSDASSNYQLDSFDGILDGTGSVHVEGEEDGRGEVLFEAALGDHSTNGERDPGEVEVTRHQLPTDLSDHVLPD